jgi:membrane protein DedA with SNARE-associated domain
LATVIVAVISASGLLGIALLMAVESACIPLPSEIIMPFSGYLVSTGRFSLFLVATAGALGCNLGSTVAYYVGYRGGRPLIERWGSYILMSHKDLERAESFFARFGSLAVFIARLLPVVRTFIALPAGIARMPQLKFQIYTFLGSWPWCFVLAWIGYRLGQAWETDPRLRNVMHRFDLLVVLALAIAVVWYLRQHWRQRVFRRSARTRTPDSLSVVPKRK